MRRLNGASLLEAVVAAVLFLTVFAAVMELLPRLTVRDDDALAWAEAQSRLAQAAEKYATGLWPCGKYTETEDRIGVRVLVAPYRDFADLQVVTLEARIEGSDRRIALKIVVQWN